jgi:hypothetical protein
MLHERGRVGLPCPRGGLRWGCEVADRWPILAILSALVFGSSFEPAGRLFKSGRAHHVFQGFPRRALVVGRMIIF